MRMPELLKRIRVAREAAQREIAGNASSGGTYARGLATEGWAGGYLQALDDVDAVARHGCPEDPRNYWRDEEEPF